MKKCFPIVLLLVLLAFSCKKDPNIVVPVKPDDKETIKKDGYPVPPVEEHPIVDYTKWELKNGKFYLDGKWKFLKIGKPLYNFANPDEVAELSSNLEQYRQMHYDAIEINCYCHFFDFDGDGVPDVSLKPLADLFEKIYNMGMYPCLSVETYTVGGGRLPDAFFEKHPEARAVNDKGEVFTDTEYGTGAKVVSIFSKAYQDYCHTFIKSLASALDTRHILWFETSVEPQYLGTIPVCFSDAARKEYEAWRLENGIVDEMSRMPDKFPISWDFVKNPIWNKFRAQYLAKWVGGDAAAWREVAGKDAYVAVDYLDTRGSEMFLRLGEKEEFLRALDCANVIQTSGHWNNGVAYGGPYVDARRIMKETGRDWVLAEHMTLNGSDFAAAGVDAKGAEWLLENSLRKGTRMGWEFVNIRPNSADSFCVYDNHFKARGLMKVVENYWGYWLAMVKDFEEKGVTDWN